QAGAAMPMTLYVSPAGSNANACTQAQPCLTIGHAVSVAMPGDTISVAKGTYAEGVTLSKKLRLIGWHHPTVDATGKMNGFLITGSASARSVVRGFVVENATQEGILAVQTSWVTIR